MPAQPPKQEPSDRLTRKSLGEHIGAPLTGVPTAAMAPAADHSTLTLSRTQLTLLATRPAHPAGAYKSAVALKPQVFPALLKCPNRTGYTVS